MKFLKNYNLSFSFAKYSTNVPVNCFDTARDAFKCIWVLKLIFWTVRIRRNQECFLSQKKLKVYSKIYGQKTTHRFSTFLWTKSYQYLGIRSDRFRPIQLLLPEWLTKKSYQVTKDKVFACRMSISVSNNDLIFSEISCISPFVLASRYRKASIN